MTLRPFDVDRQNPQTWQARLELVAARTPQEIERASRKYDRAVSIDSHRSGMPAGSGVSGRGVPLLVAKKMWRCPSCGAEKVTQEAKPHMAMHSCPAMHGLVAQMAEVTTDMQKSRHVVVEREDYVNGETVQEVNGKAVMAIRMEREDGSNDVSVFAPLARLKGSVNGR